MTVFEVGSLLIILPQSHPILFWPVFGLGTWLITSPQAYPCWSQLQCAEKACLFVSWSKDGLIVDETSVTCTRMSRTVRRKKKMHTSNSTVDDSDAWHVWPCHSKERLREGCDACPRHGTDVNENLYAAGNDPPEGASLAVQVSGLRRFQDDRHLFCAGLAGCVTSWSDRGRVSAQCSVCWYDVDEAGS